MASCYDNVPAPTDANGCVVPLNTRELVHKGETLEVYGFDYSVMLKAWFVKLKEYGYTRLGACTMPDSWEKLEEDIESMLRKKLACYYFGHGQSILCRACPANNLEKNCKEVATYDILCRIKSLSGLREGRKDVPKAMVSQPMAGETDELCLWDGDGDERVVLTIWELRDLALRYALYGGQTFEAKRCEDTACGEGREASCDRCASEYRRMRRLHDVTAGHLVKARAELRLWRGSEPSDRCVPDHYAGDGLVTCSRAMESVEKQSSVCSCTPMQRWWWMCAFKYVWRMWSKGDPEADMRKAIDCLRKCMEEVADG